MLAPMSTGSTLMATRMSCRMPALAGGFAAFAGLRMVRDIAMMLPLTVMHVTSMAVVVPIEVSEAIAVASKIGR